MVWQMDAPPVNNAPREIPDPGGIQRIYQLHKLLFSVS